MGIYLPTQIFEKHQQSDLQDLEFQNTKIYKHAQNGIWVDDEEDQISKDLKKITARGRF